MSSNAKPQSMIDGHSFGTVIWKDKWGLRNYASNLLLRTFSKETWYHKRTLEMCSSVFAFRPWKVTKTIVKWWITINQLVSDNCSDIQSFALKYRGVLLHTLRHREVHSEIERSFQVIPCMNSNRAMNEFWWVLHFLVCNLSFLFAVVQGIIFHVHHCFYNWCHDDQATDMSPKPPANPHDVSLSDLVVTDTV